MVDKAQPILETICQDRLCVVYLESGGGEYGTV